MNPKNSPALFSITTRLQPGVKPAAQIDEKLHAKPAPQPDPEPHAKPAPQPDAALSPYLRPAAKLPILLLILLLGCHSTQPVADDRYVDHNGVVTYVGPDWETTTNPFGWGMVGATTAAGAWLGTRGDGILGEGTSPFLSGLVGGVVGGGLTLLGNELLAPDPPGYWAADSVDWLAAMDERLLLVETAYRGGRHRLSGMYDTAWRSFTPKNAAELQTYIRAFGLAAARDQVASRSVEVFPHGDLPLIDELFPHTDLARRARQRFGAEARSLDDLRLAASVWPETADSAAWYGLQAATTRNGIAAYLQAFPQTPYQQEIVEQALGRLGAEDLRDLAVVLTDSVARLPIGYALLDMAQNVVDVRAVVERFPSLRPTAERRAAEVASTTSDFRHYLSLFPDGKAAAEMERRLREGLKVPENLGGAINTAAAEYGPVISPDGSTLYFTRSGTRQNQGGMRDEDIWVSHAGPMGSWGPASNLRELNNYQSNAVISVTPDGNTLLLHGEYGGREWTTSASITHRTAEGWSRPEPLKIDDFYNTGRYMQSFLANDGKTLLMAIERREGEGRHDIYVSFLKDDGSWTKPKNLGKTINTLGADDTPFLASDGRTLYFSSDGRGGLGKHDIFVTRRLDDSWTRWSEPVNLGAPVNTPDDDVFFFIPASGDLAYFASERSGAGGSDIFRILLPDRVRPNPVVLISGTVRDRSTGEPIGAEIFYENLTTGREAGRARSDPATGAYKITLPAGADYGFRADAEGYIAIADNVDLSGLTEYRELVRDLDLVPIRAGEIIRLNNIFFDVGSARLRSTSRPELDRLAQIMRERPTMQVEILGHTDSVGTEGDNLRLSEERAASVANYLVEQGVSRSRLVSRGFGESEPVGSNGTEEGRALNRRVEVKIVR